MKTENHFEPQFPEGWLAIARSRDIKINPVSLTCASIPLVAWRYAGGIGLIEDRCSHRNVALSKGKKCGKNIQCPYHGWQFNNQGHCVMIPGKEKAIDANNQRLSVPSAQTIERHGIIFANFSNTVGQPYGHSLTQSPDHFSFVWKTIGQGELADIAENFLDGMHTHFVHSGLIRSNENRQKTEAEITRTSDRVEINYTGESNQNGLISRLFEKKRTTSHARFILPGIAELEYRSATRTELLITAYLTPKLSGEVIAHCVFTVPGGYLLGQLKRWILTPFFLLALRQDQKILKLQKENIQKFNGSNFHSTNLDLMRPHIDDLLIGGKTKNQVKKRILLL